MKSRTHISSDLGIRLAPGGRRWVAVIVVGFLLLLALALTDRAGAAAPCPKGATPVYVPKCKQVCVSGRCHPVCAGWNTYCRYPSAKRTAGLAAPAMGNRDGCPLRHRWPGGTCTVSDSGVGWVSARCEGGFWFERAPTARTFRAEQVITVTACIFPKLELGSAPGYRLRIR